MTQLNRRRFLERSAGAGAVFAILAPGLKAVGANERIRVGIMGSAGVEAIWPRCLRALKTSKLPASTM